VGKKIQTEVHFPAPTWYYAEDYHQQYLARPGARPYCSARPLGIDIKWDGVAIPEAFAPKLPEAYWDTHKPFEGCVIRMENSQIAWPPSRQ
jgi:peptide-methionine (S)-S-oxide reductase